MFAVTPNCREWAVPSMAALLHAECGAFGLNSRSRTVSGDIHTFRLTDAVSVVNTVGHFTADFCLFIGGFELIAEGFSAALIKTSAAGSFHSGGLSSLHNDFIFAAAMFAVVNTAGDTALQT